MVRGQGQRHGVRRIGKVRRHSLVGHTRKLIDERGIAREAGRNRRGEDVAQGHVGRLPDSPGPLLLRHAQALVGKGAEVLRVVEGVCVQARDEHQGGVCCAHLRRQPLQGHPVRPLVVRRLAGDVAWHVCRVEGGKDVGKQVRRLLDQPLRLVPGNLALALLHGQHYMYAAQRHGGPREVLHRVEQHVFILLVVWNDGNMHDLAGLRTLLLLLLQQCVPVLCDSASHPPRPENAREGEVCRVHHRVDCEHGGEKVEPVLPVDGRATDQAAPEREHREWYATAERRQQPGVRQRDLLCPSSLVAPTGPGGGVH
mmetsp:Transcript_71193/g.161731  ORF Transcript_71193/g.161731 Transcript_71193/m.161731 type:complete len:312 (-) Transcript_71193:303-1238(-)